MSASHACNHYRHSAASFAVPALLLLHGLAHAGPEDPAEGGQWGPVIDWPHIAVSAANLPDGRILTWSGSERETWPTTEQTYSATWNPATGEFVEVFHEGHNMFCAHLAMLEDGRVFVNGGRNQTNSPWTSIFDFRDNGWVQIENMESGGRWYPTTVALADGDIFTAIGTASLQRYPERWNVDTGWEIKNGIDFNDMVLDDYFSSGTHGESRWWPLLHVAPNGQVFHSGPTPKMHYIDPDGNGSYTQVGAEFTDFYHKHGTTIMYDEGKLLTAGGWISGTNVNSTAKSFTVDLNGPSPIVAATADMHFPRKFQNGVMLPTGKVLVIGGNTSGQKFSDSGTILETEIWDPDTGTWTVGAAMTIPRNYHSVALLLVDGRVLAAGSGYCSGSVACGGSSHKDGQVYSPPYLFNADGSPATRPAISSGPGRISSGEVFTVTATPGLAAFSLIKMSSTTHGVNTDVRFVDVPFVETAPGTYELTAHPNRNVMTAGYWMLFGLDAAGVPSVAHVVQANTSGMPWLATIPQQSSQEGEPVSVQVRAGDADDDPLQYGATGLPPGLSINAASGEIGGAATTAGFYDVTVSVTDNDEGSRQKTFSWLVFGQGLGSIRRDWWTGINGAAVDDLTGNGNFPDHPSGSDSLTAFEAPVNWADNYGTRIHGYLTPTVSGQYRFYIASDDGGALWLSTDGNAANRVRIAHVPGWSSSRQWTKYAAQASALITLEAGETYYIEALQKEAGGGDNLAVGWLRPGASTVEVIPGAYLSPDNIAIKAPFEAKLDAGSVSGIGSNWVTIDLPETYEDMVVVATARYDGSSAPLVTRVRNAAGSQFQLRLQNPGAGVVAPVYTVDYLVAEKGVYSGGGASFEAGLIDAAVTDNASSWAGQQVPYQQTYTSPAVVGQVTGDADASWSVFWASDGTAGNPPSASSLHLGRHVGEDTDTVRVSDRLAYLVFESGSYQAGGVMVEAGVGAASVAGVGNSPPYLYALTAPAEHAVLASAGMNGVNGGWPVLYGASALSGSQIALAIDEDQIGDTERSHAAEEVAYVAVSAAPDEPLTIEPIIAAPEVTGAMIEFTAQASGGFGLEYDWNFGDGTETGFGAFASVQHNYAAPGRYVISVTVRDPDTLEEVAYQFVQLVHWPLTPSAPTGSSTIALQASLGQVWNVNPDNDTVTVITDLASATKSELPADDRPISVQVAPSGDVWVVNRESATIAVYDPVGLSRAATISLAAGSAPEGLAFHAGENVAFVMQEATGDLVKLDASTGAVLGSVYVGRDARHVSVTGDGSRVLVTRFITPTLPNEWTGAPVVEFGDQKYGGEVVIVEPFSMTVQSTAVLEHSERGVSEHTGPGVPNYLGPAVVSPDGTSAWVPSKQDNILAGALRGGPGLTFDQTVRAITSKIDLATNREDFAFRVDHDNASVASYAAFGPYGAYLFTALEGNREVSVSDAYTATELMRFDVGRAPQGLTLSSDGRTLFVHNFMDRTVGVYDVSAITGANELAVSEIATIGTVGAETLAADVLLGKQLFYDARDPRLALDSYMSCASCHNDGGQDGRIWDFTGMGEGLRNTITLRGRAATAHGFLHWSANFDELQDFEDQIRTFSMGTGLMSDADYFVGTRSTPLGDAKSGLSGDLDALAAYVASLDRFDRSPYREADGSLTPEGEAGRQLFQSEGCASCHTPPRFTDSANAVLNDVGTIKPSSGGRLGGNLDGLDTPTLISLWNTGPYLHDGSAQDVTEAITAHSGISLSTAQLNSLGAYLEQLDGVTALITDPSGCADCVDLNQLVLGSYSNQDLSGGASVQDGGASVYLEGNTWKIGLGQTYTITPNTMLAFTFESSSEGEIHGIGFDESGVPHDQHRVFRLYGRQDGVRQGAWGIADFATYTGPGPESFVIPVGQYYTGTGLHLVFVNDDDTGPGTNTSKFTDIRVYEFTPDPAPPVLDDPGAQTSSLNTAVSLQVTANDVNGDALTFLATGLPTGLTMSPSGLVTGVPTVLGTTTVTVTVDDGVSGTDTATFDWTVVESSVCAGCVDLNLQGLGSYSNQDLSGGASVQDGGASLYLEGNTWKIGLGQTYTITPNTMLAFTFESSSEGEIHGIGFDESGVPHDQNRVFRLYGRQDGVRDSAWGIADFATYTGPGPESFVIPVGQYYTGTGLHLVFVNDDDTGPGTNTSKFTDIRVYEFTPDPAPPVLDDPGAQTSSLNTAVSLQVTANDVNGDALTFLATGLPTGLTMSPSGLVTGVPTVLGTTTVTVTVDDGVSGTDTATFDWTVVESSVCAGCVDLNLQGLGSYSNQDLSGGASVQDGGASLYLEGNTWKIGLGQTYTITPNTMLSFTFESSSEGEIHGIGFDESGVPHDQTRVFRLYGRQDGVRDSAWGIADFATYTGPGPEPFVIPVGQYYTGTGLHLVFVNDDDTGPGTNNSRFTDVKIYESGSGL